MGITVRLLNLQDQIEHRKIINGDEALIYCGHEPQILAVTLDSVDLYDYVIQAAGNNWPLPLNKAQKSFTLVGDWARLFFANSNKIG